MSSQLVVLGNYNGVDIMARAEDNFVDVTQLCQAHGREYYRYAENDDAKRFVETLSRCTGIPVAELICHGGQGKHFPKAPRIMDL